MSIEKIDALEERISKVVELVKALKEEKLRLQDEVTRLGEKLKASQALEEEALILRSEKDQVRERLEKLLQSVEGLAV
jgi:FtsZ-binding cell division protein ZapB